MRTRSTRLLAALTAIAAAWIESESRRKGWTADYRDEVEHSLANHLRGLDALPISTIIAA